ncbi:hypothetical protein P691DRAFT_802996 [Macrolepiota fuliginosa MF-IS2]|uniref:Uncharacterized protein n=1 Tax=Macrolepiota fuliginosa MF-IS2 TaxID=1400762 RepID=A0A9P5XAI0_9AGAR|nr:hypothetical protein P691DRAFT_802996 [Macrolepiota fuliginosa MF-IS2]
MISRSLDIRMFYAPLATAVGFIHRTAAIQFGDQTKELMRKVLVVCQTASHPLLEPGPGSVPLIAELEEFGGLAGQV